MKQGMLYRPLSDMESNGVYFEREEPPMEKGKGEDTTCHYSGLPSVMSYQEEDDYHMGHS